MLAFLAPFLTGAVVGWMIFYFVRKYDRFTPKTLLGTLSALFGGDVTAFLLTLSEKFSEPLFHLRYFAGAGSGFFLYAVYLLIVNILYNRGKIRDKGAYSRLTAGETSTLERLRQTEAAVDEFEGWLQRWYGGEISDEALADALKRVSLTREDYDFCRSYGRFDAAAVALFEKKGMVRHLREKRSF